MKIKNTPTVSVIVPTYNRANLIARAIKSVLNQTYQNFEIIVVDDKSTDGTKEVVKNFKDKRIKYICLKKNSGTSSKPRNVAIEKSQGKYIAFLDSDDEWLPEKLEKQIAVFQTKTPHTGVIYTGYFVRDWKGKVIGTATPKYRGIVDEKILISNFIGASTVMVKRECLAKVGGFDTNLPCCQDWDMWIKLSKHFEFDFIPENLVEYHMHNDGRTSANFQAVIKGYETVLKKFSEDIEKQKRKVKANCYFNLGNYYCHLGNMHEARHNTIKAILIQPWNIKYFIYLFASFFSSKMYSYFILFKRKIRQILFVLNKRLKP